MIRGQLVQAVAVRRQRAATTVARPDRHDHAKMSTARFRLDGGWPADETKIHRQEENRPSLRIADALIFERPTVLQLQALRLHIGRSDCVGRQFVFRIVQHLDGGECQTDEFKLAPRTGLCQQRFYLNPNRLETSGS